MEQRFPKPAKERLIQLAKLLNQFEEVKFITSSLIEKRTGWSRDSIRRDISLLPVQCGTALGYDVKLLKQTIENVFNISSVEKRCCLVGLGKLGSALINFEGFEKSSFKIKAGFDANVNLTEVLISPFPLFPINKLDKVIQEMQIEFAILAVPDKDAQKVALKLSECGIKGIVNYTSSVLNLTAKTRVQNISVIDALQKLSVSI